MGKKRRGQEISGWINLNKPPGLTSTEAIGKIRRFINPQKIGHAGTLDPLATGVLPIAMGEATKTIPFIQDALKTYSFTITWGEQRTTDDSEGDIVERSDKRPVKADILAALEHYAGEIEQVPPQFSAVKIEGKRAYDIARGGERVEIKPRKVFIESLRLISATKHEAQFQMTCGKGTYVRSLARDIGLDLGCFGYISQLRRDAVGSFTIENAISLDNLENFSHSADRNTGILKIESVLDDIPALSLKADEASRLRNGQVLSFISKPDFRRLEEAGLDKKGVHALALLNGRAVAIVQTDIAQIRPVKVFNL